MIKLFILIIFCFVIANQIEALSKGTSSVLEATKRNRIVTILSFILLLAMILFSGLRTSYNDTSSYLHGYTLVNGGSINLLTVLEPYGGFDIFQGLLKKYISEEPQTLIMASSIVVNTLYFWFFAKHSKNFAMTILSYFVLGPYLFSMAGIKQILAMSIGLLAIDNMLKKQYVRFVLWILLAMTFHPYIICLFVLPLLTDGIWNKKTTLVILVMALCVSNLDLLIRVASYIGKDYTIDEMTQSTINPMRVIIEMLPVFFAFVSRNKMRKSNNKFLNLGINMLTLNGVMILAGLFMSPIYCGRIATYFSTFVAITVPWMLNVIYQNSKHRRQNIMIYYALFIIYFVLDLTKLGSISLFTDLFKHISIF